MTDDIRQEQVSRAIKDYFEKFTLQFQEYQKHRKVHKNDKNDRGDLKSPGHQ